MSKIIRATYFNHLARRTNLLQLNMFASNAPRGLAVDRCDYHAVSYVTGGRVGIRTFLEDVGSGTLTPPHPFPRAAPHGGRARDFKL